LSSIYGLLSGVIVWALAILSTLPFALFTFSLVPVLMWFSLRWFEDALSSFRAAVALLSLLAIGPTRLSELRATRSKLHERVMKLATSRAELPQNPEKVFDKLAKDSLQERGGKVGRLGFFSVRRRRKKDYNEVQPNITLCSLRIANDKHAFSDHAAVGSGGVSDVKGALGVFEQGRT
jgi:glycerol-3-phosphate O-acyltransferase/dihydroxyacetone phosphate acyltransferase